MMRKDGSLIIFPPLCFIRLIDHTILKVSEWLCAYNRLGMAVCGCLVFNLFARENMWRAQKNNELSTFSTNILASRDSKRHCPRTPTAFNHRPFRNHSKCDDWVSLLWKMKWKMKLKLKGWEMLMIAFHENANFLQIFHFNWNSLVTNSSTSVLSIDDCFQLIEIPLFISTWTKKKIAQIIYWNSSMNNLSTDLELVRWLTT